MMSQPRNSMTLLQRDTVLKELPKPDSSNRKTSTSLCSSFLAELHDAILHEGLINKKKICRSKQETIPALFLC